jgi:hypothetical protein
MLLTALPILHSGQALLASRMLFVFQSLPHHLQLAFNTSVPSEKLKVYIGPQYWWMMSVFL